MWPRLWVLSIFKVGLVVGLLYIECTSILRCPIFYACDHYPLSFPLTKTHLEVGNLWNCDKNILDARYLKMSAGLDVWLSVSRVGEMTLDDCGHGNYGGRN